MHFTVSLIHPLIRISGRQPPEWRPPVGCERGPSVGDGRRASGGHTQAGGAGVHQDRRRKARRSKCAKLHGEKHDKAKLFNRSLARYRYRLEWMDGWMPPRKEKRKKRGNGFLSLHPPHSAVPYKRFVQCFAQTIAARLYRSIRVGTRIPV